MGFLLVYKSFFGVIDKRPYQKKFFTFSSQVFVKCVKMKLKLRVF